MNIEEIALLAKNLIMEAQYSKWYYDVLLQYDKMRWYHLSEFNISANFYSINETALVEALAMRLARLYDDDRRSVNIRDLLSAVDELLSSGCPIIREDGKTIDADTKHLHILKLYERCYFRDKVQSSEDFRDALAPIIGTSDRLMIEVTPNEMLGMYKKRFNALGTKIANLVYQRNKLYAHNDKDLNFDFKYFDENKKLCLGDIKELIEYAMDYSMFCYQLLTGKKPVINPEEITDWKNTVELVRIGLKHKNKEDKVNSI